MSTRTTTNECAYGHTQRQVGCVSCVLVFDRMMPEVGVPEGTAPVSEIGPQLRGYADALSSVIFWLVKPDVGAHGPRRTIREAAETIELAAREIATLRQERDHLRGAMDAQDEREQQAGARCGVPYEEHGCDWPDGVAEKVLALKADRDSWRRVAEGLQRQLGEAEQARDALTAALQQTMGCPHDGNCACAIGSRHFWHNAFCEERDQKWRQAAWFVSKARNLRALRCRVRAGDTPSELASEYGLPVEWLQRITSEGYDLISGDEPESADAVATSVASATPDPSRIEALEADRDALIAALATLEGEWRKEAARVDSFHATMGTGWKVCADQLASLVASVIKPDRDLPGQVADDATKP